MPAFCSKHDTASQITEWLGLGGTRGDHLVQPKVMSYVTVSVHQATTPSQIGICQIGIWEGSAYKTHILSKRRLVREFFLFLTPEVAALAD